MAFTSKQFKPSTWAIFNHGSTAYLVVGEREGALIDTGDAPEDIRAYAESLCHKPVRIVLNTHGHFDHTGANGFLKVAYMGRLAAEIAKSPNGGQDIDKYPLDYEIQVVDDGFTVDLGNYEIEAFRMDGHSPDCVAWLDKGGRTLFGGDNIGPMVPLRYKCRDPQPSLLLYAQSCAKLMARREEFDNVCNGHAEEMFSGDVLNYTLIAALLALDGQLDADPNNLRPAQDPSRNAGDVAPDFQNDAGDVGFVMYKNVGIKFDKRYMTDTTRYPTVIGT